MILSWRGQGCNGDHVRDVKRRDWVCWRARRGQWHAEVYLRRDGQWGWDAARVDWLTRDDYGGRSGASIASWRGLTTSRRRAQKAARNAIEAAIRRGSS